MRFNNQREIIIIVRTIDYSRYNYHDKYTGRYANETYGLILVLTNRVYCYRWVIIVQPIVGTQ